jgi:hypothetical protein
MCLDPGPSGEFPADASSQSSSSQRLLVNLDPALIQERLMGGTSCETLNKWCARVMPCLSMPHCRCSIWQSCS